jgi:hypothetical protein
VKRKKPSLAKPTFTAKCPKYGRLPGETAAGHAHLYEHSAKNAIEGNRTNQQGPQKWSNHLVKQPVGTQLFLAD